MSKFISYSVVPDRSLVNQPARIKDSNLTPEYEISDISFVCGSTAITAGQPVYISNDLAYVASGQPCHYIALNDAVLGGVTYCQRDGFYRFAGTNGTSLWNVEGTLTNYMPRKTTFYQYLGYMISNNECLLSIEEGVWNV